MDCSHEDSDAAHPNLRERKKERKRRLQALYKKRASRNDEHLKRGVYTAYLEPLHTGMASINICLSLAGFFSAVLGPE